MDTNDRTFTGNFGELVPTPIKYGEQNQKPRTTADSLKEGRLIVDVAGKKRKILKKKMSPPVTAQEVVHRDNIY
jgi:hypothetical protein